MKIKVITSNDYKVSTWAGGKTRELFLFPPGATYKVGEFGYRISSATIDLETSKFSPLDGYHRLITPLNQELKLLNISENVSVSKLPYDVYKFEGSDHVESQSKCTDFNLIYSDDFEGSMFPLNQNESLELLLNNTYLLYATQNLTLSIVKDEQEIEHLTVSKDDSVLIQDIESTCILRIESIEQPNDQVLMTVVTPK